MDKRAKQNEKRARRLTRGDEPVGGQVDGDEDEGPTVEPRDTSVILELLATLQRRFDDGQVTLDDYEQEKADLLAEIQV
jgi:hypothetical protein